MTTLSVAVAAPAAQGDHPAGSVATLIGIDELHSVTPCTPDSMISDLQDGTNYEACAAGDLACFRSVGVAIAQTCLHLDLQACGNSGANRDPAKWDAMLACMDDRATFPKSAMSAIVAELPSPAEIRDIGGIGFTEERRIVQELEDLNRAAWPPACGPFPAETMTITDRDCAVRFFATRLEIVSGIAAVLHGAADAF